MVPDKLLGPRELSGGEGEERMGGEVYDVERVSKMLRCPMRPAP